VLRNAAGLSSCHFSSADRVEQGRLLPWSTWPITVTTGARGNSTSSASVANQFLEFLFGQPSLQMERSDFITKALTKLDCDIVIQKVY